MRAWYKTYGLPTIITNCSNNFGPYQFPEKLIPLTITNLIDKKNVPIYGDGKNIRDWIYVDDHCEAIYEIANNGEVGESYCIGSSNEITNIDIVRKICFLLDELTPGSDNTRHEDLISFVKDRPGHDFRYAIDSGKLKSELGWSP